MNIQTITPEELGKRLSQNPATRILDVRTPVEFREVHLAQAKNVPLDRLTSESLREPITGNEPLFVVCQSGARARQACERLAAVGVPVVLVEGGTKACIAAGLEVVRGRKGMSLERQVRIAAGTLVLIGCALAFWVDPLWLGLSAFIGAGLVFAGITDTCGMGMLLARMPWNQVSDATSCDSGVGGSIKTGPAL